MFWQEGPADWEFRAGFEGSFSFAISTPIKQNLNYTKIFGMNIYKLMQEIYSPLSFCFLPIHLIFSSLFPFTLKKKSKRFNDAIQPNLPIPNFQYSCLTFQITNFLIFTSETLFFLSIFIFFWHLSILIDCGSSSNLVFEVCVSLYSISNTCIICFLFKSNILILY